MLLSAKWHSNPEEAEEGKKWEGEEKGKKMRGGKSGGGESRG